MADINAFEQNAQALIAAARAMLAYAGDVNPPIEDITFGLTQYPVRPRVLEEIRGELKP